jgi:hypothetical protein
MGHNSLFGKHVFGWLLLQLLAPARVGFSASQDRLQLGRDSNINRNHNLCKMTFMTTILSSALHFEAAEGSR